MTERTDDVIGGRYRLVRLLGEGGMGRVWQARDETLRRDVALKLMRLPEGVGAEERAHLAERVRREAQMAAQLDHPGIVRVHDIIEHDGAPAIVMEYVDGRSLGARILRDGPLPAAEAAQLGAALLEALRHAHAKGVVHRDLKPDNILLSGPRAVITDFGIARPLAGATPLTTPGTVPGTLAFMAPEQIDGKEVTTAGDLWSLGVTLYVAVEGRLPFAGDTLTELCAAILTRPMPQAPAAGPLAELIGALLVKDPADRANAASAALYLASLYGARTRWGGGGGAGGYEDGSGGGVTLTDPVNSGRRRGNGRGNSWDSRQESRSQNADSNGFRVLNTDSDGFRVQNPDADGFRRLPRNGLPAGALLAVLGTVTPFADDPPHMRSVQLASHLRTSPLLWTSAAALVLLAVAAVSVSAGRLWAGRERLLPWTAIVVGALSVLATFLAIPLAVAQREGDYVHPEVGFYLWGVGAVLPVVCGCWELLAMRWRERTAAGYVPGPMRARYAAPRITLGAAALVALIGYLEMPKDEIEGGWGRVLVALMPWGVVQGLLVVASVAVVTLVMRPSGRVTLAVLAMICGLIGAAVLATWHSFFGRTVNDPTFVLGEAVAVLATATGLWLAAARPAETPH